MAAVYTGINEREVIDELKRRGFGLDFRIGVVWRLTRPTGKVRKYDNLQRMEPIGGIKRRDLDHILNTSDGVKHAADRVQAICEGRSQNAFEGDAVQEERKKVAPVDIDTLVEQRVAETLAKVGLTPDLLAKLAQGQIVIPQPPPVETYHPPVNVFGDPPPVVVGGTLIIEKKGKKFIKRGCGPLLPVPPPELLEEVRQEMLTALEANPNSKRKPNGELNLTGFHLKVDKEARRRMALRPK